MTILHNSARLFLISFVLLSQSALAETDWPALPVENGSVNIPAQSVPRLAEPRTVKVDVYYPGGSIENVTPETGLMLSLHNWGGTGASGTAKPKTLVDRYNLVVLTVDYLQSGQNWKADGPYDFGFYQSLDAIRALFWLFNGFEKANQPFDHSRIFATGGSGGGNVTLMVNKLAPRTLTCGIDICGMNRLTDSMAFGNPSITGLNAGYSCDKNDANYLTPQAQAIRFVGHPDHLRKMKELGGSSKMVVVHGLADRSCPVDDAWEMVKNFEAAGLDVEPYFITRSMIDGKAIKTTGHSLGNRTEIVDRFAAKYLAPDRPTALRRSTKTDFELRDEKVCYRVPGGQFVISYKAGYPVARFEAD
jgi:poly(3-hydroxybutyrate) depolymerase